CLWSPKSARRLRFNFFPYTIENAIDELRRLGGGEFARNFDRLVDYHGARGFGEPEQFRNRCSEDIAIHRGHAVHAPVLGVRFDQLVDLSNMVLRYAKDIFSKTLNFRINFAATRPECLSHLFGCLPTDVGLKEHLQCQFAGFATGTHRSCCWRITCWRKPDELASRPLRQCQSTGRGPIAGVQRDLRRAFVVRPPLRLRTADDARVARALGLPLLLPPPEGRRPAADLLSADG